MKNIISLRSLFGLLALSAIFASTVTAQSSQSTLSPLHNQVPPPGKAVVYFFRPSLVGALIPFEVKCDGQDIGSTTGRKFIYTFVEPGLHTFTSKAENKVTLTLETEAGNTYLLRQDAKMGVLYARNSLKRVEPGTKGAAKFGKCKISGDCPAHKEKEPANKEKE